MILQRAVNYNLKATRSSTKVLRNVLASALWALKLQKANVEGRIDIPKVGSFLKNQARFCNVAGSASPLEVHHGEVDFNLIEEASGRDRLNNKEQKWNASPVQSKSRHGQ